MGRAIAAALAADGHAVAVADIDGEAAQAAARPIDGLAVELDMTDTASVDSGVGLVEQRLGRDP